VDDYGHPPVRYARFVEGRRVCGTDPPATQTRKAYLFLIPDLLSRQDLLEVGTEVFECLRAQDVEDRTTHDLAWRPTQPVGVAPADPHVPEITATPCDGCGHGVGDDVKLLLQHPQRLLRAL